MDPILPRFINDLIDRLTGPLHFRFLLQPVMATFFGIRDGLRDAREGKPAYFWEMYTTPARRKELLRGGLKSVLKILILAVILDAIYQIIALHWFYIGEDLVVAMGLAFVPYLLIRGPTNRIARWWARRHKSHQPDAEIPDERRHRKAG